VAQPAPARRGPRGSRRCRAGRVHRVLAALCRVPARVVVSHVAVRYRQQRGPSVSPQGSSCNIWQRAPARCPPAAARANGVGRGQFARSWCEPAKAELDGLPRAQELLYQGRLAWAIARLDELDHAGVGSVLLEERAATRAIAECRLGALGTGKADEYARRFPRSAHLERVRASCAGAPQEGAANPAGGAPAQKVVPTQTERRGSQHE
jgi:hypothetical protein